MKKIKILGIVSIVTIILILVVSVILAVTGIFGGENQKEGSSGIMISEAKTEAFEWQTSETEGDIIATLKTDSGDIVIKLADSAAAEKFIELSDSGAFKDIKFTVAAEDMFLQTENCGEGFSFEKNGFAPINNAVGFVIEDGKAYPSLVIITAEELSKTSSLFLSEKGADKEKTKLYKDFGGVPEYEEKLLVFGMVVSGTETIEAIFEGENSGYTGGYSLLEPAKINELKISFPEEIN